MDAAGRRVHFPVPMVSPTSSFFEPSPRQIRGILQAAVLWFIIGELFGAKALSESHPSVRVPPFESSICTEKEKKIYPLPAPCPGSCCSSHHGPCMRHTRLVTPPNKVAEFQQSISTDRVDFGSPAAVYIRSSGRFDTATHRNLPSGSQKAA